jgi:hypothetical protein
MFSLRTRSLCFSPVNPTGGQLQRQAETHAPSHFQIAI